jgi:hypothetical protein
VRFVQGGGVGHLPVVRQQPADRLLVVAHDVGGEAAGEREQFLVRHHVVDQARAERLGGGQEVARQRHLDGAPQPDGPRQQDRHAAARHDAHPRVRVGEARAVRRHEERALQGHLEAAGDGGAVDRADHRLADDWQEPEQAVARALRSFARRSGSRRRRGLT